MKKYLLAAASALLLAGASSAQDTPKKNNDVKAEKDRKKDDKKLKEYEEIIIKRKDDKDTKVTIEIKDDEVFVDGKPIDDFEEDDITVQKRGPRRMRFESHDASPFRADNGGWSFGAEDMELDMAGDRPFLGVTSEGSTEGAKVTSVSENSAAAKAGLKAGDVITKVNDKAVFDHEQLSETIGDYKPNDKVTILYKRDGKENKAAVTLGERPRTRTLRGGPNAPNAPIPPIPPMPPMMFEGGDDFGDVFNFRATNDRPRLGLKVQDTEDGKGVKVLDVDEGSVAEKAGIKKDDVITSFEGKDVSSAGDLARASREMKDKSSLKVQLNRNGKAQTIDIKVPKKLKTANL